MTHPAAQLNERHRAEREYKLGELAHLIPYGVHPERIADALNTTRSALEVLIRRWGDEYAASNDLGDGWADKTRLYVEPPKSAAAWRSAAKHRCVDCGERKGGKAPGRCRPCATAHRWGEAA